jgi:DNA (cytosine-5)-methyltransferase 1
MTAPTARPAAPPTGRPVLLDAYCGAGGAARGYQLAGFYVVGVDVAPQPRYAGDEFHRGDAIEFIRRHGREVACIHASPPCQGYSEATPVRVKASLPRLIAPTRDALAASGRPYVIENVAGALPELRAPLLLCGSMFGLRVWRHRYFECPGIGLLSPSPCAHNGRPITIHCGSNTRKTRGVTRADEARRALGVPWMTRDEAYEAIPPAYTLWLGGQLLRALGRAS